MVAGMGLAVKAGVKGGVEDGMGAWKGGGRAGRGVWRYGKGRDAWRLTAD